MDSSNKPKRVYRDVLKSKPELIAFFKFLDARTTPDTRGKPYTQRTYKYGAIGEAMAEFKATRPTVLGRIRDLPNGVAEASTPKRVEAAFVGAFENTEAWKRLRDHKYAQLIKTPMGRAFQLLGNLEPKFWSLDDIKDLRKPQVTRNGATRPNTLYNPNTKDIRPEAATNIRRALKDLNLYALVKPLEDVEKGHTATRREWYLSDAEIKMLLANVDQLDLLLFIWLELQCGARPISMVSTKVSDINFEKEYITYFESKKKTQGERYFIAETFQLLQAYISDMHIGKFDRLFKQHQNVYSDAFKKLGVALGIELFKQEGAAAYTLRHTFATQSSDHDVSLEVVMSQGGWSESSTLMKHYVAVKTSKKKRELLGVIEEKPLNFGDWIKQFVPIVKDSYARLRQKVSV
jgi:integrase